MSWRRFVVVIIIIGTLPSPHWWLTAAECATVHPRPAFPFACFALAVSAEAYPVQAVKQVFTDKVCVRAAGIPVCAHPEAHAAHSHVPAAAG